MQYIKTFCIGIILGIANVIPGVSGGTIAVVFNVYDRLINIITLNIKKILKDWLFILLLILGILVGVFVFARLITWLFDSYPVPTAFFFIGIILGSIPFIGKRAKGERFTPLSFALIACGIGVMAAMFFINRYAGVSSETVITELSVSAFFLMFLFGFIGAIAMIIPGISGSLILLIIGGYRSVIRALSDFNIPLLVPLALGILSGLLIGAGFVRFLLARVPVHTYCIILGLVIGSVLPVFPGLPGDAVSVLVSAAALLLGGFISWFFSKTEGKAEKNEPANA
ncbi:DUF368 domain-containing protein [Brucepastera parasyntrophica]|uniref:DUF368 domain-containing protein n=1 Tax=Brucepastera parasyntrophica TaxID=2880008 RepID=UPI00210E7E5B|nr:DUF368 domain-containing protein [Brucepastera parasyntrophica]ULQ59682.1 DUF368 domain-containing protein [Brucepastera parasyntrophica]